MIENEIIPYLPLSQRGFPPRVSLAEIVNGILYKLKTGVQWHQLPVRSLFEGKALSWQSVYHHYRKWSKKGAWKACWVQLLSKYRKELDLSSSDLDGSHTTALRGEEQVVYQGRKKRKTTNVLLLSDRQGLPIAMSSPVSGNHNDLFEIGAHFEEVTDVLEDANIGLDGLFLNADAGFDSKELRDKDDFGLTYLEKQQQIDLMELIEDRHGKKSTIIASQLPVASWYDVIGEETIADAILDRLVHSSHRIHITGDSMRKKA